MAEVKIEEKVNISELKLFGNLFGGEFIWIDKFTNDDNEFNEEKFNQSKMPDACKMIRTLLADIKRLDLARAVKLFKFTTPLVEYINSRLLDMLVLNKFKLNHGSVFANLLIDHLDFIKYLSETIEHFWLDNHVYLPKCLLECMRKPYLPGVSFVYNKINELHSKYPGADLRSVDSYMLDWILNGDVKDDFTNYLSADMKDKLELLAKTKENPDAIVKTLMDKSLFTTAMWFYEAVRKSGVYVQLPEDTYEYANKSGRVDVMLWALDHDEDIATRVERYGFMAYVGYNDDGDYVREND